MKKPQPIKWDSGKSVIENASTVLPLLVEPLFVSGRKLSNGKVSVKALHEFRLEVKRFRYTLELFRPLYGPALNKRLAELHRLQQMLGRVSDCAAIKAVLKQSRAARKARMPRLLKKLNAVEKERTAELLAYWKGTFDRTGEQELWVRYLRDYPGRGSMGGPSKAG